MKSEEITEYCTSTVIPNMKVSVSIVLEGKDCSSMSRQVPSSGDGTPSIEGLAALGCRLEGSSSIEERGMDVKRIDGICSGGSWLGVASSSLGIFGLEMFVSGEMGAWADGNPPFTWAGLDIMEGTNVGSYILGDGISGDLVVGFKVGVGETVLLGAAVGCRDGVAVGGEAGACGEIGRAKVGLSVRMVGIIGERKLAENSPEKSLEYLDYLVSGTTLILMQLVPSLLIQSMAANL
jgi:hypothetical protein